MMQKIRDRIGGFCTLFAFEYNGKEGNVDPYYIPDNKSEFLLYFDGEEQTVYSLDDVMQTNFVDGLCLADIADIIKITEW